MLVSDVSIQMPEMDEVMELFKLYAPTVLVWCALALAATLVLRLILALLKKHSALLRALSWLSFIVGVVALGGYWVLTGEVPAVMDNLSLSLSGVSVTVPEQLKQVNMTGLIILAVGAVMAFLARPFSRMFGRGDGEKSGDSELVIKTIGWLLAVLGALVTFGVI